MKYILSALLYLSIFNCSFAFAYSTDYFLLKTNKGSAKVALFNKQEPELAEAFINWINEGYYNNLIFHKIIKGFILQGGAYDINYKKKIVQLKSPLIFKNIKLKNLYATVAVILNKDHTTSAVPQFFINLADNYYLNKPEGDESYQIVGKVISGMDILENIANIKVGQREELYYVPVFVKEAMFSCILK